MTAATETLGPLRRCGGSRPPVTSAVAYNGKFSGEDQRLQIHEGSNRKPSLDPRRPDYPEGSAASFVVPDEEIELDADPHVQQQKRQLKAPAQRLRAVLRGALFELFARGCHGFAPSARVLHFDGARKEDVVLQMNVTMKVVFELFESAE